MEMNSLKISIMLRMLYSENDFSKATVLRRPFGHDFSFYGYSFSSTSRPISHCSDSIDCCFVGNFVYSSIVAPLLDVFFDIFYGFRIDSGNCATAYSHRITF